MWNSENINRTLSHYTSMGPVRRGFLSSVSCVRMTENLTCGANTTELVKKAQQRLYFLMILQKNNNPQKLVVAFYLSSIGSILAYCLCVWYSSCTVPQRKALQRASRTQ